MLRTFTILILFLLSMGSAFSQEPDLASLRSELRTQYTSGKYDDALKAADAVVAATKVKFGKESIEVARAWADMATVLAAKGDSKRSLAALDDAAAIFEKHPALDKADAAGYATVLERIGSAKFQTDLNAAERAFKRALEKREIAHGADSPETATALSALANIRFWRREYKDAADTFRRALENLGKGPQARRDDVTLIYHRARCSLRKAKLDDEAEALKQQYSAAAEFASLGDPAAGQRKPRTINAGVVNGKALSLIKPRYPVEARADGAEGIVEVDVLIDEQGDVISACSASKAHPALGEASEAAAYASKFSPTKVTGNPVKVTGVITYNFRRY